MNAVITADIVNSTQMNRPSFNRLMNTDLLKLFGKGNIEVYRGDSFQALVKNAEDALRCCVISRLLAIRYSDTHRIDIRMSIGLGILNDDKIKLGSNMAELLISTGRSFDKLQASSRKLYITSGNPDKDFTYDIIAEYLDSILERTTPRQAEVLYHILLGKTQVETAGLLKKNNCYHKPARKNCPV